MHSLGRTFVHACTLMPASKQIHGTLGLKSNLVYLATSLNIPNWNAHQNSKIRPGKMRNEFAKRKSVKKCSCFFGTTNIGMECILSKYLSDVPVNTNQGLVPKIVKLSYRSPPLIRIVTRFEKFVGGKQNYRKRNVKS